MRDSELKKKLKEIEERLLSHSREIEKLKKEIRKLRKDSETKVTYSFYPGEST